jgi:hypothetical protein
VPGIGEQRQRPGQQAGCRFDRDIRHVEADADCEGAVELGAPRTVGMAMRVRVPMGVGIDAGLSRFLRVLMIWVRSGLRHAAASATAGGWFLAIDRIWCATARGHRKNRVTVKTA